MSLATITAKKVGGVPVIYLAGGGAVILAVVAWRMKSTASAPATDVTNTADPNTEAATGDSNTVPTGPFVSAPVTNTSGDTSLTNASITTNAQWTTKSVEWLVANGYADVATAQRSLGHYLDGADLSYDENSLVNAAVKQYGLPPDAPTPGQIGSKPVKWQGSPPATHTVQGGSDDTFAEIAQHYYGNTTLGVPELYQANPSLPRTAPLAVGTQVKVPVYTDPVYVTAVKPYLTLAAIAKKNGVSYGQVLNLNPGITTLNHVVTAGTRVRIK